MSFTSQEGSVFAAAAAVAAFLDHHQALRLHQERHLAHTLSLLCRVPCLRHAPLKELTRLAAHLKETMYSKGKAMARPGWVGGWVRCSTQHWAPAAAAAANGCEQQGC